mmetsp:Transcript_26309/g.40367  ORF Transcript_26309/g.40367 Transcript_26309/m.40367 type:complete len:679 (+) Transcript_26309:449-2485(+)|eukprot:CAMPEP_0195292596 /NCGR_PEP_ID=MMETSP0707-20130614/10217_1 /TAXON_ID=33640 /ORGANISM="Asterionellopsis glacialis, Strain CCMP134" /LENGTH=678 /DNA_ID=CAMNT_0040353095 /DNA_START=328 /DNA_END=2364 /DNA_ORIENTATION=-
MASTPRVSSLGASSSNGVVTFSAETTLTPRPKSVIIAEEDDEQKVNLDSPEQEEDVIPGPKAHQSRTNVNGSPQKELDESNASNVSDTQHHRRRGSGFLASHKDLNLPANEFAAGCNLLQAAARGDISTMSYLLQQHPRHVDFRDYDRRTALHVAASEGHLKVCQFLVVTHHAKINRSDRWGGSPLDDAHRHRHEDVVKFLRTYGATTGSADHVTNLITAAAEGDMDEVRLLLLFEGPNDSIHKSSTKKIINEGDYDKRTALHLASGEGHTHIVELLCESGASVNAEDRWGGRPIDDALTQGQEACVTLLKKYGGKPSRKKQASTGMDSSTARKSMEDNMQVNFTELEMIERIGAGAFGEIYKCRWRGTLVAAKCIKSAKIRKNWLMEHALKGSSSAGKAGGKEDLSDVDLDALEDDQQMSTTAMDIALQDFRQELQILRSLRHPNICLLLAYSTTENYEVMISELMKCSLLDVLKANIVQNRRMTKRAAIQYAIQLAQGMNYLHTCKPPVIHRDLKPANLLIDHSGVLKVADFGLAKARPEPRPGEQNPFVMTGETGSYRFMAPEVYRREYYTETVDIYSYAMIFYYLLSGRPPWPTLGGPNAVAKASDGERPVIPRDWSWRISTLLQQCWDENPNSRPPFSKIIDRLNDYTRDVFGSNPNVMNAPESNTRCSCIIS